MNSNEPTPSQEEGQPPGRADSPAPPLPVKPAATPTRQKTPSNEPTPDSAPPLPWDVCKALWLARAKPPLRHHGRTTEGAGAGLQLARLVKNLGAPAVMQAMLWMCDAPDAEGRVRDPRSKARRGWDTLWNNRAVYPELAEEWLASDATARRLAVAHGVPLPDGVSAPPRALSRAEQVAIQDKARAARRAAKRAQP